MSVSLIDGHIDDDTPRMTDNEIIEALSNDVNLERHYIVHIDKEEKAFCTRLSDLYNLIISQKAEIERLNRILHTDVVVFRGGRGNGKSETIKKIIEARVAEIRAKAYKECIEKAKEILHNYCIELVDDDLDNLVKEMVGAESG